MKGWCGMSVFRFARRAALVLIVLVPLCTILIGCAQTALEDEVPKTSAIVNKEKQKQETIALVVQSWKDGKDKTDDGRNVGKILEDLWKENINDEVITTLHYFDSALFWHDVDQTEDAKDDMRKVSPDYDGPYAEEVKKLGLSIFKDKATWAKQHEIGLQVLERERARANGDLSFETDVYHFVEQRYEYYDKQAGKYSGDKYTNKVFQDTADKFKITVGEVKDIWGNWDVMQKVAQLRPDPSANKPVGFVPREASDSDGAFIWTIAKEEVKKQLKSPSTAKFPLVYHSGDIMEIEQGVFTVNSYVDAQNSFGATIRSEFMLIITKTGQDTYVVNSIYIV